jgi:hypothetical protein
MIDKWQAEFRKRYRLLLYRLRRALPHVSPAWLAACGVLAITGWALFVPPYIGMADNGDYFRILYPNGLYFHLPDYDSRYFGYFVRTYGIFRYYNENSQMIFSSQSLFIHAAVLLNKLFYSRTVFDLRFQAGLFTFLYAAVIYLLVEALTWRVDRRRGLIIAALAVFVFADTAYTAYFQSFFGESVVLLTLLATAAGWLLLVRGRFNVYATLALFVASSLLLTTSKQQNAPIGLLLGLFGLSLLLLKRQRPRPFRHLLLASLGGLMAAGIGTYVLIPEQFVHINQYHAMTRGLLLNAIDPEKTLAAFGIDRQYAILQDSIYYEQYSTVDVDSPLLQKNFYSRYGFLSVLRYYLENPNKLGQILDAAAKQAFTIRPGAMGNYEQSAGQPFGAQTRFFSLYSLFKRQAAPKTFGFIILWASIVSALYLPGFVSAWKRREMFGIQQLVLIVALLLTGLSGILVSIIGAGDADLAKHEFVFTLVFDLVTFIALSDAIAGRLRRPGSEGGGADDPRASLPSHPLL